MVSAVLVLAGTLGASSGTQSLLYSPDPNHLWNRIDTHLRIRTATDGTTHGADALDPLLWRETRYLLDGSSHATALKLLDEFLSANGERLVGDPASRALMQRDLWATFDWAVSHFESNAAARHALAARLARVIRRLGLTEQELTRLTYRMGKAGPQMLDTYTAAVKSGRYPPRQDPQQRERAFLPPDLLDAGGRWVAVQSNTPVAQHSDEMSRSHFAILISVPGGRAATMAYLRMLWDTPRPFVLDRPASFGGETRTMIDPALHRVPVGTQVALVRTMLLLDAKGEIHYSRIVESLQLRVFRNAEPSPPRLRGSGGANDQDFYEFILDRAALVADPSSALRAVGPNETAFLTFSSHGIDLLERKTAVAAGRTLEMCAACHGEPGLASVLSARRLFKPHTFAEKGGSLLDGSAAWWKTRRADWGHLRAYWLSQPH